MLINLIYVILTVGKIISAITIGACIYFLAFLATINSAGYSWEDFKEIIDLSPAQQAVMYTRIGEQLIKYFGKLAQLYCVAVYAIPLSVVILLIRI